MKTPSFDELRTFVCLALLCDTEVCPMASHGTLTRAYSTHPLVMKYADLLGRVTPSREYETSEGWVLEVPFFHGRTQSDGHKQENGCRVVGHVVGGSVLSGQDGNHLEAYTLLHGARQGGSMGVRCTMARLKSAIPDTHAEML